MHISNFKILRDNKPLLITEMCGNHDQCIERSIQLIEPASMWNLRVIRPGDGLHPRYFESLLGSEAQSDLEAGKPFPNNIIP